MADDESLFLDDLDLTAVTNREELAELLNVVYARADAPSYRSLSAWASRHGKPALPKTTVGDILRGKFPRKDKLLVFLEACGVVELKPWRAAWERIAAAERRRQQEETAALEQRRARALKELEEAQAQAGALVDNAHVLADEIVVAAKVKAMKLIGAEMLGRRAEDDVLAGKAGVAALVAELEAAVQEEIAQEPHGDGSDKLTTLHAALMEYALSSHAEVFLGGPGRTTLSGTDVVQTAAQTADEFDDEAYWENITFEKPKFPWKRVSDQPRVMFARTDPTPRPATDPPSSA